MTRGRILVRMVALATLLCLAWTWAPRPARPPLVVSVPADATDARREAAVDRAVMLAEARRLGWVGADPVIGRRLVANLRFLGRTGPEAALLDEALTLGMDLTDPVVTSRLLDRMERVLVAPPSPPTEDELHAFLRDHGAELRAPDRVHLRQVFLAHGREPRVEEAATNSLIALRLGQAVASDPLLDLRTEEDTTAARVAARYGPAMGQAVSDAPVGEWVGPVRSPFGLHLLRVERRTPGALPPLPEVRAAVVQAWSASHAQAWRRARLDALRTRWPVVVEVAP